MFQAIAMYDRQEVGYGESETAVDAMLECADSVPSVYPADEVQMHLRKDDVTLTSNVLSVWLEQAAA